MHGSLAQRNPLGAASLQLRPVLLPSRDDIPCFIVGDDIFLDGHNFPASQEKLSGAGYKSVDLPLKTKLEVLEGGEQSAITMSNLTSASGEASVSSGNRGDGGSSTAQQQQQVSTAATATPNSNPGQAAPAKRKRNLPGTPDPDAEVISLSPKTLMATNRFVCEICNKGFQRDQNLQLHRRGHNLPWKLKQRTSKEIRKRVYICPEPSCVHHDAARALGDLTGIKKHFCRKHGEKKWKCEKCSKRYAVQSDWKAHSKTCGTREYRCDCGTLFSRRDSFITHRAFCDALAEESARVTGGGVQLPGNHSNALGGQPGGPMGIMGAPSSPGRANMLRLAGTVMDPLSPASFRPGFPGSASRLGFPENGLSLVPPRWDQHNVPGSGTPGSRPKLALWLGTGPGPGPPSNEQLSGAGHSQLQPGGSSSLNGLDMSSNFFAQSPKNVQSGIGMASMFGLSDYEGQKPMSGMIPMGSSGSGSQYGNLFGTGGGLPGMPGSNLGQGGGITGVGGMSGLGDFGGMTNWQDRNSAAGRLSLSSTANGLASNSASGNVNAAANLPSVSSLYNQAHPSSAQMSATALLQKAAQMGATASNTSLLRGFGMAGSDSSSGGLGSAWPQDQGRGGMLGMVSSLVQSPHPFMRGPSDLPSGSQAILSSTSNSTPFGGSTRNIAENAGLHELMNSLSGSSTMFNGMGNLPSSLGAALGDSANMGGMFLQGNGPFLQRMPSRDQRMGQVTHAPQQPSHGGGPQSPLTSASVLAGLGSSRSRGEEGPSDRQTRDFLGVGGASGMVGAPGIGRTLSQREIASITSLGQGIDMATFTNQRDNIRSVGLNGQSPGRSWDAS